MLKLLKFRKKQSRYVDYPIKINGKEFKYVKDSFIAVQSEMAPYRMLFMFDVKKRFWKKDIGIESGEVDIWIGGSFSSCPSGFKAYGRAGINPVGKNLLKISILAS